MTRTVIVRVRGWLVSYRFWLLFVISLAVFLRLYHLDVVPPGMHFDEIINGEIAQGIRDQGFRIFYLPGWGREGLYHVVLWASLGFPLPVVWQMRLPSVLLSVIGILLTYGWANRYFDRWTAIAAVTGLGFSFWSLALGRAALRAAAILPLAAAVIWLTLDIIISQGRGANSSTIRRSSLPYWLKLLLLAICMGAMFYTYRAARILPFIFLGFLIYLMIFHRPVQKGLIASFVGSLLIAIPLILFLTNNPGAEQRIGQVDLPWQELINGNLKPVRESALATLGMFGWKGDLANHYNLSGRPVFEPLGFGLFLAGVAISLLHWRQTRYALIVIWLFVGLVPGMLAEPAPHFIHTVMALPVVFAFPGIAVSSFKELLSRRYGRTASYSVGIIFALWIGASLLWTYRDYFIRWPQESEVQNFYQSTLTEIARYLDKGDEPKPTSICTEFLNEQDPFWRSGRQSMPFLLNRSDLDLRWYDCRFSHVLPTNEASARYVLAEGSDFAPWLPEDWFAIKRTVDTPEDLPYGVFEVNSKEAFELLTIGLGENPTANLAGVIEFLGSKLGGDVFHPGDTIDLYTYWRVVQHLPSEMSIFVHLLDGNNNIITQGDALTLLSDTLLPGDIVIQRHTLSIPGETSLGSYRLAIGVYSRQGEFPPLQIVSPADGSLDEDRIWLSPLEVTSP